MDPARRKEIEGEERVRAQARSGDRDRRVGQWLAMIVLWVAPAAALVRGEREWYWWAWLAVGLAIAIVIVARQSNAND